MAALGSLLVLPQCALAQESSPAGTTLPDTVWNCSGWHTVAKGDSCSSIEKKYNITAKQFLAWNPSVSSDCTTNFRVDSSYCVRVGAPGPTLPGIAANCDKWHIVAAKETCLDLEKKYNITADQFFAWNPAVSRDCGTNFWAKYAYCVGIDKNVHPSSSSSTARVTKTGSTTTKSSHHSSTTTRVTTTTPYSTRNPVTSYNLTAPYTATGIPPQRTPAGQPGNCNRWHWVAMGDTCQSIVNLYGARLTEEQLHEYNPTLGDDCSGLYFGWYICIGVQPTTSVSIGWSTSPTNASIPAPTPFVPPPATVVQNFTASPLASGIPSSCQNFYEAADGDTCNTVLGIYNYITKDQFFAWNPSLKGNCNGLLRGVYYCVANYASTKSLMPPTVTAKPSPIAAGTTGNCTAWYLAVGSDDCSTIAFVLSDCSGIQDSVYYCVAVPGTPATRTAPLPTTPTGTLPTQTGVAANCTRYWLVSRDDSCDSIASAAGIAKASLVAWNPALGADCKGLTPDYYVCVSTAPITDAPTSTVTLPGDGRLPTTTTTKSDTASATTTGQPGSTPSPTMPGMVAGCVRFYYRGPDAKDLYCYDIAAAAGISLDDFIKWNPGVGSDCSSLWADTWYCIGVTGPRTTISTGKPVPVATASA
ncbi:carbohydrate-binding module family 50 protein [Thermothielavioides terrestris NRRL 8126]|uniref:Carbohydrate-binding module family 50 protein n=1 Tax=Thermothielavioides terrestris (strain ATCC 38088 / NRRL 8126) TaxID=578455 RepID=G2R9D2_THETT|nr:carbohydrate-binding module family 50 protein [Thermothielavioides terrestris NRRL 8126]AEO68673.1 carbohydrate-binding module family 50 protein [Thermothielavioides terrestris NRRL 8126]